MNGTTHFTVNTNNIDLKKYDGLLFSCHAEHCNEKHLTVFQYDEHLAQVHKVNKSIRRPFIMQQAELHILEDSLPKNKPGRKQVKK